MSFPAVQPQLDLPVVGLPADTDGDEQMREAPEESVQDPPYEEHPTKRQRYNEKRPPAFQSRPKEGPNQVVTELDAKGRTPADLRHRHHFGPKPDNVSHAQWGALQLQHDRFCHAPA